MDELMLFEGIELEILTKEDVKFSFIGEVLFNGIQVCDILGYSNGNREIDNYCDKECIEIITKDKLNTKMVLSLGQRGTKFITEDGVMDLIYNSKMPKAKQFKKKVREIVKEVQNTGRYDQVEQNIMKIEDEVERNLRLTIHQYESIVKINSTDILSAMMLNNKRNELNTYLQQKQINDIKGKLEETEKRINNIYVIGDRKQFTNEVNSVCRSTGMEQGKVYGLVYKQLLDDYGIDLPTRVENKKRKIQEERLNSGKKPLSPTTLKQKATCLNIADEENLWNELGKCLFAVKDKYLVK